MLPTEKEVSLEISLANFNEKLASALCESAAKDEVLARHAKTVEEALTGYLLCLSFPLAVFGSRIW